MSVQLLDLRSIQNDRLSSISDDKSSAVFSDSIAIDHAKEIKYGKPLRAAYGLFIDYCCSSSVHGILYLGDTKRHWTERIWWVFAISLSIYGCSRLITNVYNKWDQSPVIVSFAEKSTPIWEIPFPAVTICPETKADSKKFNFTPIYNIMKEQKSPPYNISDEELRYMKAVSQICDANLARDYSLNESITDSSVIDALTEIAVDFPSVMFTCKWRNDMCACSQLFEKIMTEEGQCFTFNVLNSKELFTNEISEDYASIYHNRTSENWDPQMGYNNSLIVDPEMYPYRVFGPGTRSGLFVLSTLWEQDFDYKCRGHVQGFKILLHTPGEIPQVSKHYFRLPLGHEVLVAVKPNMMTTSEGLRHYEPNRRQCYFQSERNLRFFKIYTQRNCELECLSNFTVKTCGCVKFSMPRDRITPICGASKIFCYNYAEDKLLEKQFIDGLSDVDPLSQCNCLPPCTSISYDAEISQAPLDWVKLFAAFRSPLSEFPGMQPARLSIYFKEKQFITSRRSELYGQTDFLANCGGLLGLFMGVSLLSIVEIIYFCTLRLCCNLRSRQRRKKRVRKQEAVKPQPPIPSLFVDQSGEDHAKYK